MRGWDYHPTVGLVISGGLWCSERSCESIDRVERTTDSGSTFEELAPLPNYLNHHCLKIVDEDRLFVVGGQDETLNPYLDSYRREAYMFRFSTDRWTALNPMTHGREGLACSLVENHSAQKQIVVTGGYDGQDVLDSVEIYDLDTGLWQEGG